MSLQEAIVNGTLILPPCVPGHPSYAITELLMAMLKWTMPLFNHMAAVLTILCLIVLLKHPKVFAPSTRVWFTAIIAMDVLNLLVCYNDLYFEVFHRQGYNYFLARLLGRSTCQVRITFVHFIAANAINLQSGLAVERLLSVLMPFKARAVLTAGIARCAICLISLVTFLICMTVNIFLRHPSNAQHAELTVENAINVTECARTATSKELNYYFDLIVFRVVPLSFMLLSSVALALFLRSQRLKRSQLVYSISRSQRRVACGSNNRERRASFLLLIMNVTTLLTNPVFLVFELGDGMASEGDTSGQWTGDLCVTDFLNSFLNALMYLSNQTNCFYFIAFGARFRKHIFNLLSFNRAQDTMASSKIGKTSTCQANGDRFSTAGSTRQGAAGLLSNSTQSSQTVLREVRRDSPSEAISIKSIDQ